MFEQELYEKEAAELKTEPGDLFHNYEIKNWEMNARIYKIIAVSAVVNVLAFFALGQPRLFTRGACESPFVGRICSVLDTVYVGSILFGTEREYVDKEYTKTELGDAEEITWIDQTGIEPQFTYPEGYFYQDPALVAQNEFSQPGFLAPGIPSNPTTSSPLIDTPQVLPRANPNAVTGKEGSLFSTGSDTEGDDTADSVNISPKGGRRPGSGKVPSNSNTTTAGTTNANVNTNVTGPVDPDEINSRPFTDLAAKVNDLVGQQKLDLQAQFQVAATAKLKKDGTIASFKFTKAQSTDPEMVTIVKNAIEAFNDSNLLQHLKPISGEKLDFSIQQDQATVVASIQSQLERESKAKAMVTALQFGITLVIDRKKDTIAKLEAELAAGNDPDNDKAQRLQNSRDDLELLNNTKVTNDGKLLKISFGVQKEFLHQMLKRKLDEQAAQTKKAGNSLNSNNASVAK